MEEATKIPVGGRLLHFAHKWKGIGALNKVFRWLRRGYRLPFAPQGEDKARFLNGLLFPEYQTTRPALKKQNA